MTIQNDSAVSHRDYYLMPLDDQLAPVVFNREILTIGRSETCDIRINSSFLSFVHASIFIKDGKFFVSDLNSTNGTFINGVKVTVSPLIENDILSFGPVAYRLVQVNERSSDAQTQSNLLNQKNVIDKIVKSVPFAGDNFGPPPLPTPMGSVYSTSSLGKTISRDTTSSSGGVEQVSAAVSLRPVTPLDIIPELNYSEFIFEENIEREAFEPQQNEESALEIAHFHENFMISVDYFTQSQKILYASSGTYKNTMYIPFLGSYKRYPLLKFEQGSFYLLDISEEFKINIFNQQGQLTKLNLEGDYIKLSSGQVVMIEDDGYYLMLKHTKAPPRTLIAPFLLIDNYLSSFIYSAFVLWAIISALVFFIPQPEKELVEIPLEVDRIIYKEQIKPKPLIRDKSNSGEATNNPTDAEQSSSKVGAVEPQPIPEKPEPPAAVAPKLNPNPPKLVETPSKVVSPPKPAPVKLPPEPNPVKKSQGPVEPKKIVKVAPEPPKEVAPKLDLKSLQTKMSKTLDNVGSNSIVTDNSADTVDAPIPPSVGVNAGQGGGKTVGVIKSTGANQGTGLQAPTGNLGSGQSLSSGTGDGLGTKIQGYGDAGTKTVVLGNLDPRDVQNILRRYLPQFKFCYEKELEKINKKVATTLVLDFYINGDGRSKQEKFSSSNIDFSGEAIECFDKVLSGIQFPKPKGGGDVKIRQPLNMEPGF